MSVRNELLKRKVNYSFEIEEAIESIVIDDIELFNRELKLYLNKVNMKEEKTDSWVFESPYHNVQIEEYTANDFRKSKIETVKIQNKEVAKLDFNKLYELNEQVELIIKYSARCIQSTRKNLFYETYHFHDVIIFENPSHKMSYSVRILDSKLSFGVFNKNKIKSDKEIIRFDSGAKIRDPYIYEYKIYKWNTKLMKLVASLLKKMLSS